MTAAAPATPAADAIATLAAARGRRDGRFPATVFHGPHTFFFDRVGGTGEAIYQRTADSGERTHVVLIDEERAAAAEARRMRR